MNMADIYRKPNSLRSKLFGYMILLAVVLIFCVLATMLLLGQVPNVKENYYKELDMQMSVLDRELSDYYKNAVISATQLSHIAGEQMDTVLAENNLSFSMLENNQTQLAALQDELFEPLKNSLLQANMSGAFVVWDTPDEPQTRSPLRIIRISARADPHEDTKKALCQMLGWSPS